MIYSDSDSENNNGKSRSVFGTLSVFLFFASVPIIIIAFVTPYWIEVDEMRKLSDTKFLRLGLWASCFTNLHDVYYYDPWLTNSYEGCRWIYRPIKISIKDINEFILPGFFVPVQICYTLSFLVTIVSFVLIVIYLTKFTREDRSLEHFLIVTGMIVFMSGILGLISIVIFGSLSGTRQWALEWQFNYLSWSYYLAVAGTIMQFFSGIFLLYEARFQWKTKYQKEMRMDRFVEPPKNLNGHKNTKI